MGKKSKNLPFEVDFKTRLAQSKAANNAVRLPRLGYAPYRVYDIEEKKDKKTLNGLYGSGSTGKSTIITTHKSRYVNHSLNRVFSLYFHIIQDLEELIETPPYKVKWLKPKHVTLLKMKGHRAEPTTTNDKDFVKQTSHKPVGVGV